jgi:hypothetical protein
LFRANSDCRRSSDARNVCGQNRGSKSSEERIFTRTVLGGAARPSEGHR